MDQERPPEPPRRRRRLTIEMVAMLLLSILVVTPALIIALFAVRCSWDFNDGFCTHNWGFKDWLTDTIPVLVAIIMRGGVSRGRDDE